MTDAHRPPDDADADADADAAITQSRMERLKLEQARAISRIQRTREQLEEKRPNSKIIDTALGAFERDVAAGGGVLAGAVAFRVFLFMIPYVFLLVVIFGLGASAASEDPGSLARDAGIGGLAAKAFAGVGDLSTGQRILSFFVAGFALLLATRSLLKVLRIVHALVWHTSPGKPKSATPRRRRARAARDRRPGDLGVDREGAHHVVARRPAGDGALRADPGGGVDLRELAHAAGAGHAVDRAAPGRGGVRSRSRGAPPRHRVLDRQPDRAQDRHVRRHRVRAGVVAVGVSPGPAHHVGRGRQRDALDARCGTAQGTCRGAARAGWFSRGQARDDGARSGRPGRIGPRAPGPRGRGSARNRRRTARPGRRDRPRLPAPR